MASGRSGRTRRSRRKYSSAEHEAAVADVAVLGLTRAAEEHGMPVSTLCIWAKAQRASATQLKAMAKSRTQVVALTEAADSKRGQAKAGPAFRKRPAKRYTPSQRAQVLEDAAKDGPSAASEKHGCSRFAIYDWSKKVERAATGQATASPTSGPAPSEVEAQRDQEILDEWHRHPGLGPSQIRNQLRAKCVKVAVNTVRRVMEDAGYRPPKIQRQPHDQCYEAVRPNHLWHLDFVHRHIHRATTFTLILIDDHSRYVVGHGVDEVERADMVIETFEEAVRRHGKPEMVMHDKGGSFWSWRGISRFTALLTELGIDQIVAEHKEWNGKVEVFNANLHKELFNVQRFVDVSEMKRRLTAHLHFYNHGRTHHALGGLLVPADRYFGRAEEVLARIESGVPRDATDALELRDRCQELFKVASKNGVPEIWLMGQRLLPPPG
jgi:putative transposase